MDWSSVVAGNTQLKSPGRHGPAQAPKEECVGRGRERASNNINELKIFSAGCRDSNSEGESDEPMKTHDLTGILSSKKSASNFRTTHGLFSGIKVVESGPKQSHQS
ncbi:hypothetical protein Y1Q_0007934 [Alligator mississippiensis]|uniref:Uncharacterized protein n=1 Tax=Alligator mississippiensis TaxID=8496 RepID=A0A151NEV8_ALLMI|nr:hypothetical protein Y1Q_0007934 [Alligator mississippiensis]